MLIVDAASDDIAPLAEPTLESTVVADAPDLPLESVTISTNFFGQVSTPGSIGGFAERHNDLPEWIQLLPLGDGDGTIEGRDGRIFRLSDPAAVIAATRLPLVVDFEHASELAAPQGKPAPAAGWVEEMKVIEEGQFMPPGLWGRVEWTPRGATAVKHREYRYLSPSMMVARDDAGVGEIRSTVSCAITNKPNLELVALNHSRGDREHTPAGVSDMQPETTRALCSALGVTSPDEVVEVATAIRKERDSLKAELNSKRTELEASLNREAELGAKIQAAEVAAFESHRDELLDAAVEAGRVTPGARDGFKALCSESSQLDHLKGLLDGLPVVATLGAKSAVPKDGEHRDDNRERLTDEEASIARLMGLESADVINIKKGA